MKNYQITPMELLDFKSIGLCLLTYFGLLVTKSDVIFMLTVGVGLTTISYNVVRIFKSMKRK